MKTNNINSRLRNIIDRIGTQAEFSRITGVSKNTIHNIYNDHNVPNIEVIAKILECDRCRDVDIYYLITGKTRARVIPKYDLKPEVPQASDIVPDYNIKGMLKNNDLEFYKHENDKLKMELKIKDDLIDKILEKLKPFPGEDSKPKK